MIKLYLSDEAYSWYRQQVPQRKIHLFMHNLSHANWSDNRPEDLKQADSVREKGGYFPLWLEGYSRIPRGSAIDSESITRLAVIGLMFKITKHQDRRLSLISFVKQGYVQHASNVLEAIGQQMLITDDFVVKPSLRPRSVQQKLPQYQIRARKEIEL